MPALIRISRPWDRSLNEPARPAGILRAVGPGPGAFLYAGSGRIASPESKVASGQGKKIAGRGGIGLVGAVTLGPIYSAQSLNYSVVLQFVVTDTAQASILVCSEGALGTPVYTEAIYLNTNSGTDPSANRICAAFNRTNSASFTRAACNDAVLVVGRLHTLEFHFTDGGDTGQLVLDGVALNMTHANSGGYDVAGARVSTVPLSIGADNVQLFAAARLPQKVPNPAWLTKSPKNLWGYFLQPRRAWASAAAAFVAPVLSLPTVTNITATSATPRVTITI